jgi:pimeloyl-ACP methyl ester carboxylesterase
MKTCFLLFALFCQSLSFAADVGIGTEERIATREGVTVPIYTYWRDEAVATVVLFSGGGGGYGQISSDGWPGSGNFLIRTGRHWATYPFNLIMVGRPSDGIDLAIGRIRSGDQHAADNLALFKAIKQKSPLPIWVVGTSMGTISAASAAIRDSDNLLAGLVLTSSITAYKFDGVPKQPLEKIRVPTLVLHHEHDGCPSCSPDEARNIARQLKNAPIRKTVLVSGGGNPKGDRCEAFHYHGYIGMENEAVDLIAAWILKPTE